MDNNEKLGIRGGKAFVLRDKKILIDSHSIL